MRSSNVVDDFLDNTFCKYKIELSDDKKEEIINCYNKKRSYTSIGKRILIFNICMIIFYIVITPVTAYAAVKIGSMLYEAIQEKVENAELSEDDIQMIIDANGLVENFDNVEFINNLNELQVNENGQTYGPDILNADLIAVISDQGEEGYVYREELYDEAPKTPEEAISTNGEVIVIKVYLSDGITEIGTFTVGR
ncbi:MAG: hypothetical protein E7257_03230 [Lachnospiraceae bacterium]|nr:hypothetical protein [Lachnospiraceae bacterium]